ncbi:MAG: PqqD family peptide modification chaperone [Burkholderiaceae bacterium]
MAEQLLSDDWYRVAKLRPSVRSSVQIARHSYRGVIWYVLHDPVNGRHHRVNRTAYELLARLDGSTTVDTVWRDLLERLGDDAPTQGDVLQALAQLNEAQLLHGQLAPDARQLERRAGERRRAATLGAVNPLSFRLMLFDPSAILVRLDGLARTLFSVPGAWAWGALAALAALVALVNLSELFATASAAWREPRFLFVMWIIYPLLKIAHEFSHGMAVRRYGGTVTELGVRLLVLTPVPYVDASSSTLFANKRERALVAAAGIAAELLIASLAVFVWAIVEDGLVREAALAAIVIGSVSTLAFNGNPLLRFDAYYVLADLLEIPNLGPRSSAYWRYLAQHRLLGLKSVKAPPVGPGEVPWLIGYGAASWVYRLFVFGAISIFIADIHWTLGAMVIAGGIWTLLLRPAWKGLEFVMSSPALSGKRQKRARHGRHRHARRTARRVVRSRAVHHRRRRRGLAAGEGTRQAGGRRIRDDRACHRRTAGAPGNSDPHARQPRARGRPCPRPGRGRGTRSRTGLEARQRSTANGRARGKDRGGPGGRHPDPSNGRRPDRASRRQRPAGAQPTTGPAGPIPGAGRGGGPHHDGRPHDGSRGARERARTARAR